MEQVACHQPSAPSWAFLRDMWGGLKSKQNGGTNAQCSKGEAKAGRRKGGKAADVGSNSNLNSNNAGAAGDDEQVAALLRVVAACGSRFPVSETRALVSELRAAMLELRLGPAAAVAHVAALHRLAGGQGEGREGKEAAQEQKRWCVQVSLCRTGSPFTRGKARNVGTCVLRVWLIPLQHLFSLNCCGWTSRLRCVWR